MCLELKVKIILNSMKSTMNKYMFLPNSVKINAAPGITWIVHIDKTTWFSTAVNGRAVPCPCDHLLWSHKWFIVSCGTSYQPVIKTGSEQLLFLLVCLHLTLFKPWNFMIILNANANNRKYRKKHQEVEMCVNAACWTKISTVSDPN